MNHTRLLPSGKTIRRTASLMLALILALGLLAGCGGQTQQPSGQTEPGTTSEPGVQTPVGGNEPAEPDDGAVSTVDELMEAIAPGAEIVLAEGVYDLTDWAERVTRGEVDTSKLDPSIDATGMSGYELEVVISDLDSLTIRGRKGADVQIVSSLPYADVLRFEYCWDIKLVNLTLGHTVEPGTCSGDVLEFLYCSDIRLEDLDLYGCGTYGIVASRTQGLEMRNSVIRECSYGLMDCTFCSGLRFIDCEMRDCAETDPIWAYSSDICFENCDFHGNATAKDSYGGFVAAGNSGSANSIRFLGCSFGADETKLIAAGTRMSGSEFFDDKCSFTGTGRKPVVARTPQELFEAIGPGVSIQLTAGTYQIGDWFDEIWAEDEGREWNATHPYVSLRECFGGVEAIICNLDGLSISGAGPELTRVITGATYADIFAFNNCQNIALSGMSVGHVETAYCEGDVVDLVYCSRVALSDMDLYGCGVVGVNADSCEDLMVYGCTVHDCSGPAASLYDCSGNIGFYASTFTDCAGFSIWDCEDDADIAFGRCRFGEWESNMLYFRDDIETYDCEWSEITEYPDYSGEEEDGSDLEFYPLSRQFLADTYWEGVWLSDPAGQIDVQVPYVDENGESHSFSLQLSDGFGCLYGFYEEDCEFDWDCTDTSYYGFVYDSDTNEEFGDFAVAHDPDDPSAPDLLMLTLEESYVLWFKPVGDI